MNLYNTPCFENFDLNRDLFDAYGKEMKMHERNVPDYIPNEESILIRLDGRAFHSFTRGLARPFSPILRECMTETTKHLAKTFNAKLAFVQSDEITLLIGYKVGEAEHMFRGKRDKLISLSSAEATLFFNDQIREKIPEKARMRPLFDSRITRCANPEIQMLNFRWRQMDCVRNAIAMIAQANIPHSQLQGKNIQTQIAMLRDRGVQYESFSEFERLGTFVRRIRVDKELSEEQLNRIPEDRRPAPGTLFSRADHIVETFDMVSPRITESVSAIRFDEFINSEDVNAKLVL